MHQPAPVVAQPVQPHEAVPADERDFSHDDAVALLKGSTGSHVAGYISLLISIATLIINLKQIDNDTDGSAAAAEEATSGEESLRGEYVACAAAFATGQVIPLAKTTRDRFVASLHGERGAPVGLNALKPTTEAYAMAILFQLVSFAFCVHAVSGLADTTDEAICLILSFFFLVCSAAWVCKSTRDRSDVSNAMWNQNQQDPDRLVPLILRLARGTGSNVILCVLAWVGSIVLTLIVIWKSDAEEFDQSTKLLLTMAEVFQIIAALWLAKTVRDAPIPKRVSRCAPVAPCPRACLCLC